VYGGLRSALKTLILIEEAHEAATAQPCERDRLIRVYGSLGAYLANLLALLGLTSVSDQVGYDQSAVGHHLQQQPPITLAPPGAWGDWRSGVRGWKAPMMFTSRRWTSRLKFISIEPRGEPNLKVY
jgi:hypothetical protein